MSNLNLKWLRENFKDKSVIVFDIGCADMHDTIKMKEVLPESIFYAFDCSNAWMEHNKIVSVKHDIHYLHMAISNIDGELLFYPSVELNGESWAWSSSTIEPGEQLLIESWKWGEPYTVNGIKLSTFCDNNVSPDIIHIDAQGAEYNIFSHLGDYRPSVIWTEISEFEMYRTGVTYNEFHALMSMLGYVEKFKDDCDALYVLSTITLTPYYEKD